MRGASLLAALVAAFWVSPELPAFEGRTGLYGGFLIGFSFYFQDFGSPQRFDVLEDRETDLIPALSGAGGGGLHLGYRGRMAAVELSYSLSDAFWFDGDPQEVGGQQYWLYFATLTETGVTGRFYAVDIHRSVRPFVAFGLMFRNLTVYGGSIDRTDGFAYDAVFLGYGYAASFGAELMVLRRLALSASAGYGWHRYMWVAGALGVTSALNEPLEAGSLAVSLSGSLTLRQYTRAAPRR